MFLASGVLIGRRFQENLTISSRDLLQFALLDSTTLAALECSMIVSRRWLSLALIVLVPGMAAAEFRAGAIAVDVTPERFPVIVNCAFLEQTATGVQDRLHARCLVLDDGKERLAIVIVDSCMMPREFLDKTKQLVAEETGIPTGRQLIAATHTHSAPAVMGCLGSDADPAYGEYLQRQIVRSVRLACDRLVPAELGWGVIDAGEFTNNRRWILRSDKIRTDPFGQKSVRANMHPGYQNPDFVGPSGPTDPWLSVLSLRTRDQRPLAVLANFSMHYFGNGAVSADYFGRFCQHLEQRLGRPDNGFVAIMSQGTSGDLHWMNYGQPRLNLGIDDYAKKLADRAEAALKSVSYRTEVTLAMAETTVRFKRRTPDAARLAWAKEIVAKMGPKPKNQAEIYAREAIFLDAEPTRELKLQAVRIGDVGIAAIPNEVYALTGLKIKARSPLPRTFTIELANGSEGYSPPPEQHVLGGYTTWPARTAGLEIEAEPKIVATILTLLESVSGAKQRVEPDAKRDAYAARIMAAEPRAYWRLGELAGNTAAELRGEHPGRYEPGVVFGLDGPRPLWQEQSAINRAAQFAGGRMLADLPKLGERYSIAFWAWHGLPDDAPAARAPLLSLQAGNTIRDSVVVPQKVRTTPREWMHYAYLRDGARWTLYRNGQRLTEGESNPARESRSWRLVVGGSPEAERFEGRMAEVAVFDRLLTSAELDQFAKP